MRSKVVQFSIPILLSVFLLGLGGQAAPPLQADASLVAVDVTGLANGTYLLEIKDGGASLRPIKLIGLTPVPTPDPTPQPTDLAKSIVTEVNKLPATNARYATAMKLSAIYRLLAEQIGGGNIPPAASIEAVNQITKTALGAEAPAWVGVIGMTNAALAKVATDKTASANVLTISADAVLSTVPAHGEMGMPELATKYGFDWMAFLAFIMELLKILLPIIIKI